MLDYTNEQPVFDLELPWSIKRLFLWLVVYLGISFAISGLLVVSLIYLNFNSIWEFALPDAMQILKVYPSLFLLIGAYLFLHYKSHRINISLKIIWGNLVVPLHYTLLAISLGIALSLIWSAGGLGRSHNFDPKYSHQILFYSQLFIVGLLTPFIEELFFRGILYRVLRKRVNLIVAILISSSVFAVYHIHFWFNLLDFICIHIIGLVTVLLFEHTKSLSAPFLFHAIVNLLSVVVFQYREYFSF